MKTAIGTPTAVEAGRERPLGSGMRALLYVLTGLTFSAGTQLWRSSAAGSTERLPPCARAGSPPCSAPAASPSSCDHT
jgi:hypothetical protein